jgi:antitoxin PrlF
MMWGKRQIWWISVAGVESLHSRAEVKMSAPTSTISSKGQVTVPIEVRQRLGLREGDRVEFVFEQGRMILRPARQDENPFQKYVGILPAFMSTGEINRWVRELREDWDESGQVSGNVTGSGMRDK